jgi:hypothetical protein
VKVHVVVSDLQVPFHHERAVKNLAKFIKAYRPTSVSSVGDVLDAPQISRWHRGQRGEYDGLLGRQRDEAVRVMESLRIRDLSRSNHDDRAELYVQNHAPGFLDLPELKLERFLRLDDLGIRFHRQPFKIAPNWRMGHGDEGGLSQEPGKTAIKLAQKWGQSAVIGHTHRMGLQHDTDMVSGRIVRTKYGFEVGCLMDVRKADYIMQKGGAANWQLGFGVLYEEGRNVTPVPVPMQPDGSFIFERRLWKL